MDDAYRRAGLFQRLGFGTCPALLIVDLSLGFTDPACPLGCNLDAVVDATREVLDTARQAGIPIVFTTVAYQAGAADGGMFVRKIPGLAALAAGSRWAEIDPRVAPAPGEVVLTKQYASAFFGTALAAYLTSQGADTLIVCGATTSGCVRATVVDAIQHGFRPVVPADCVGDRAPAPHAANLLDMQAKYADVLPVGEVLAYLLTPGRQTPAGGRHRSPGA